VSGLVPKEAMVRTLILVLVGGLALGAAVGAQTVDLGRVFQGQGFGYSIGYPDDWIYQNPSAYTVVFSGAPGTEAYYSTVTLQNLASTAMGGMYTSVDDVVSQFKCELASGSDEIRIYDSVPWTWTLPDGRRFLGKGYTVEFTKDGTDYKAWEVVFPHPSGRVFCSFAYTSSPEDFDTYLPIAQAMFDSWSFVESGTTDGSSSSSATGTTAPSGITVLFQASGHIYRLAATDDEFSLGKQDKRTYTVTVPSSGYLSCAVVSQTGQWIACSIYDSAGTKVAGRAGNQGSIYGGINPIEPGTYTVVVGPMKATDDSEFQLFVYFRTTEFTLDDLIAAFGDQYRRLP